VKAIISDHEARALLDSLKLEKLQDAGHLRGTTPEERAAWDSAHRAFHYVVCRWLQEMGADVVTRTL
jgi:hypothetical protein